jgi:glycosyltransferase involved in cell wall biosynthesis
VELLKRREFALAHHDLPFANPAWNARDNSPGFFAEEQAAIDAIPKPDDGTYDVVYSISSPIRRSRVPTRKLITFMVTEFGLHESNFGAGEAAVVDYVAGDNIVVVPSRWVKSKLEDYGFPADKVHIVPHGVDSRFFKPPEPASRQAIRSQIGAPGGEFVFLNLGAMTWNKGVDVLIRAFAVLRQRHPHVRLVLKDQKKLYGIGADGVLMTLMRESPGLITEDVRNSIVLVTSTLSLSEMSMLYGAADAYVSPYRAEGFNLPVIEAIACGTPAIVTAGGATDDFCPADVALPVASERVDNRLRSVREAGFHLEPQLDSLIAQMELAVQGQGISAQQFADGRERLVRRYSWQTCTDELVALF